MKALKEELQTDPCGVEAAVVEALQGVDDVLQTDPCGVEAHRGQF